MLHDSSLGTPDALACTGLEPRELVIGQCRRLDHEFGSV